MTAFKPSRRNLLQTLALGASGLTTGGEALFGGPRSAHAAGDDVRRVVFLFLPNGIKESGERWDTWVKPGAGTTDFSTSGMTTPLEPHKADLVFFDGMAIKGEGDKHIDNIHKVLTGGEMKSLGKADRISIDQYLAQQVGTKLTPKWPTLPLGVQTDGGGWGALADGTRVPADQDPYRVYGKLFASLPTTGAPAPDPAAQIRSKLRQSVLAGVTKDLQRFRARLPAEDRIRADAQLDAIRTMEARLSTGAGAPAPGAACGPPVQPATKVNIKDPKALRDVARMQFDVLTSAFACDLTRVATVMFFDWRMDPYIWNFDPVNVPTYLHLLSHDHQDAFVKAKRVLFEEVAYFVDRLKKIPEGSGSMLDNTLIVCTTEISTGHTGERIPWVTIGGKNMGVNVGTYLRVPSSTPHNKLLVSCLNLMGVPDTSFGKTDWGTGPMPGFLKS